jgi:hypothetical protein
MKQLLIILFLVVIKTTTSFAQCNEMFDYKKGTIWEWTHYDKKGKFSAKSIQKVEEYEALNNGFAVTLSVINSDKKGEQTTPPQSLKMTCKDGVVYFDMNKFVPEEYQNEENGGMNMAVEGDNLEMPINMKPGDVLKDASVTMKMGASDSPMNMKMTLHIFDRKVEGKETLTTPAGKFDCTIISQSIKTKAIVSIQVDSKEWYCPGIGSIKSESYRKGKMTGYSILTKFTK